MAALIYGAIGFTVGALISLVIAMASSNVMKTTKNANILMAVSSVRTFLSAAVLIALFFAGRNLVSGRYALLIGGALGLTLVSIFTAFNASKQLKEASDRNRIGKTESEGNEEDDANGI